MIIASAHDDALPVVPQERGKCGVACFQNALISLAAATVLAWRRPFVGDAVQALEKHVQKYYITSYKEAQKLPYAHYTAIVQSSGMGKSRLVDQFSKTHLVVPMNLRHPDAHGEHVRCMYSFNVPNLPQVSHRPTKICTISSLTRLIGRARTDDRIVLL